LGGAAGGVTGYLLDRKNKGLDYYYPDFDDLMKDD